MVDLLTPLQPCRDDVERLTGTLRGPTDGLGAGIEVWCGASGGWRDLGDLALGDGRACVMRHRGRLLVSLTFDLGPAPRVVAADSVDGAA